MINGTKIVIGTQQKPVDNSHFNLWNITISNGNVETWLMTLLISHFDGDFWWLFLVFFWDSMGLGDFW